MNVKLYSIPWICERENFAASSDTAREDFLQQYLIDEFTNSAKLFNPPDELSVQDVGSLGYVQNVTYAAVTVSSFTWYLFITAVRRTPNNIIKFDYRIDYFQTFFRFDNNTKLRGNIIRNTGISYPNYAKYLPIEPKECKLYNLKEISANKKFYAVLFLKCESATRGILLRKDDSETSAFDMSYDEAVRVLNNYSFSTEFSLYLPNKPEAPLYTEKCEIADALIIPSFLLYNSLPEYPVTVKYTRGSLLNPTDFINHGLLIDDTTFDEIYVINPNDYISDFTDGSYLIKYGTANFNAILPVSRYDSNINLRVQLTANGLLISLELADEIIDVTSDFQCPTVYSLSTYYRQNGLITDSIGLAGKTISAASGVVVSAATGNIGSAAISAVSGVGVIQAGFENISNKLHAPVESRGNGNGYQNIKLTSGFAFFIYNPVNNLEIINEINERGYLINFLAEIRANALLVNKFYYIRYSDILITGNMPLEARERVQNIFLNGLYLHYAG